MLARGEKPKSALYPGLTQPTYCEWLRPVIEREIQREKERFAAEQKWERWVHRLRQRELRKNRARRVAERRAALKRELAGVPF
jgi:hypothetical protein